MGKQKKLDFLDASKRHYSDALFLQSNSRLPNAAQLFGLAAECGLKALIEKILNIKKGEWPSQFRQHANVLVDSMSTLRASVAGRQEAKYFVMLTQFGAFRSWDIAHRYWSTSDIPLTQHMSSWVKASTEVQKMLDQALIDGYFR